VSVISLDWQLRAACRGNETPFFGPDDETRRERNLRVKQAAAICINCPVWRPCRQYSQDTRVKFGVWGGRDVESAGGLMCRNGLHLMTLANTWTGPTGTTRCRACRNAADRRSRARRNDEREAALCQHTALGPRPAGEVVTGGKPSPPSARSSSSVPPVRLPQ
jgi:hypothetical protein